MLVIPCPRDNATARIASTPVLSYGLRRAYTILTQALDDGWRPRTPKAVLSSLSLSYSQSHAHYLSPLRLQLGEGSLAAE